jgi:hypothetical protein
MKKKGLTMANTKIQPSMLMGRNVSAYTAKRCLAQG